MPAFASDPGKGLRLTWSTWNMNNSATGCQGPCPLQLQPPCRQRLALGSHQRPRHWATCQLQLLKENNYFKETLNPVGMCLCSPRSSVRLCLCSLVFLFVSFSYVILYVCVYVHLSFCQCLCFLYFCLSLFMFTCPYVCQCLCSLVLSVSVYAHLFCLSVFMLTSFWMSDCLLISCLSANHSSWMS